MSEVKELPEMKDVLQAHLFLQTLDQVATPDELRAIVGEYQTMAGYRPEQVNRA